MSCRNEPLISSEEDCVWIELQEADMIHGQALQADGGLTGIRDCSALESALARPKHKLLYSEKPLHLATLAAAYGFGIATSHPYNDGNKRTAFMVTNVFLLINGMRIRARQEEVVEAMYSLAMGECTENRFAKWVEKHLEQ
jgi:death-on-curing protein